MELTSIIGNDDRFYAKNLGQDKDASGYFTRIKDAGLISLSRRDNSTVVEYNGCTREQVFAGAEGEGPLGRYARASPITQGRTPSLEAIASQPYVPNQPIPFQDKVIRMADRLAYLNQKFHREVLHLVRTSADIMSRAIRIEGVKRKITDASELVTLIRTSPDVYEPIQKEIEASGIDVSGLSPLQASALIADVFAAYINFPGRVDEAIRRQEIVAKQTDDVKYTAAMVDAVGGRAGLRAYNEGVELLETLTDVQQRFRRSESRRRATEISDRIENGARTGARVGTTVVKTVPLTFLEVLGYFGTGIKEVASKFPLPTVGAGLGLAEYVNLAIQESPLLEQIWNHPPNVLEQAGSIALFMTGGAIAVPLGYGVLKGIYNVARESKARSAPAAVESPQKAKRTGTAKSRSRSW